MSAIHRKRRPHHLCPGPNCDERDVSKWVEDGVYHTPVNRAMSALVERRYADVDIAGLLSWMRSEDCEFCDEDQRCDSCEHDLLLAPFIEWLASAKQPKDSTQRKVCPECGAEMRHRPGSNIAEWVCPNYPHRRGVDYGVNGEDDRATPYPDGWPELYNACNDPCDMLRGPCACGAWHRGDDQAAKAVAILQSQTQQAFDDATIRRLAMHLCTSYSQRGLWPVEDEGQQVWMDEAKAALTVAFNGK